MSFLTSYFDISDSAKETAVHCPFPHTIPGTKLTYLESNPSAHVNTESKLFNCKACGAGHNEITFMQAVLKCSFLFAKKLSPIYKNEETITMWDEYGTITQHTIDKLKSYKITEEVIKQLHIQTGPHNPDDICFPVFMYDHVIDVRTYHPQSKPKVKSRTNCPSGIIIPYDEWRNTDKGKITIVCAGEKDMAVTRSQGFNAITLTGGESAKAQTLKEFEDRTVIICYDNDAAGITGANKLALQLQEVAKLVKVCTKFHEVCVEPGEDLTDYFNKYNKTKQDLIECFKETPEFVLSKTTTTKIPTVTLLEAASPRYINKTVCSNIQVVATSEASFVVPSTVFAEKFKLTGQGDMLTQGEQRDWELEEHPQDILHLMDNNFKEETIKQNLRTLLKIPQKEKNIKLSQYNKQPVYKCYITDLFETTAKDAISMEYTAYCINCKLESGKKYMVTYKLVPHPYKGQQLTMIVTDAIQASDSVTNFVLDDTAISHLKAIQSIPGNLSQKIDTLVEKVKGILGYDGNNMLIKAIDLSYHTALTFNFGTFKNVRGYLDTFIVGESRVGKSSTADALRNTYKIGTFTSLAGNSATIPGLIGGSNKVNGSYQTRAGVIPQNHKGLIIFEEFGKCNSNIIRDLTDIRSSNEVRIARVSGTVTMPALVRMITLSNVKNTTGQIKPIASYPNGITIITELVGTAEDIARYDMLVVLADKGNNQINPLWEPEEPFADEIYQTRLRWVWSRTPEQIIISKDVALYIMDKANALNRTYDCHIKLFGTETWKKLTRLAIAIAGYTVSTDEEYKYINVAKEHVEYAVEMLVALYDNPTFKLKEYVGHERKYTDIDDDGVAALQDIYNKSPSLVLQLEQTATTNKNVLGAVTGMNNDALNNALMQMTKALFIRFENHDIIPTERFRKGVARLNRATHVRKLGEPD